MAKPIRKSARTAEAQGSGGGGPSRYLNFAELLMTNIDSSVALFDAELNVIRVSDPYAEARKQSAEHLVGTALDALYSAEEQSQFRRVLETGKPVRIRARPLSPPDSITTRYWDCSLTPMPGGSSDVEAVLVTETEVTGQVRAEQSLHKMARILAAIDTSHGDGETHVEPQQLLDTLLAETIQLTESEYGFIGQVIRPDDGLPRLQIPTILNFSAGKATPKLSVAEAPGDVDLADQETLLWQVVSEGRPALVNDVQGQPLNSGLPIGHPPLGALLCLPLEGRFTEGVVCVANCPEGYDPFLIDALQPLIKGYVQRFESSTLASERDAALHSLDQSRLLVRDLAVPAVENEHDELIGLINQCYEEMEGEGDYHTILRFLRQLHAASAEHFLHEEQLMQSVDFEEFEDHRANHQLLLKALGKHIERYHKDPEHDLYPLQEMLTTWFGRHFSTYDLRMNQHFAS